MPAEMHCRPLHYLILLLTESLMLVLVVPAEMRKRREPKKEYFKFVMNLVNGTKNVSVLNYGIFITERFIKVKMYEFFRSVTGQN